MKIVISPAKSLDITSRIPTDTFTQPQFLTQSKVLVDTLKKKTAKELAKLMKISDNLGQLNYERNQNWTLPFTKENARQAIYTFTGDVYKGFDVATLPLEKLDVLQNTLRILSGQYGLLKPLDLMQPYRLEMGTKLKVGNKDNLYKFWDTTLTNVLNKELKDDEVFVNLASNEYFKAIQPKQLKVPVITPVFKELKGDTYKVIAIFAKKARGLMARYIIDNDVTTVDGIKSFNIDGYGLDANLSTETELVFTRKK